MAVPREEYHPTQAPKKERRIPPLPESKGLLRRFVEVLPSAKELSTIY